MNKTLPIIIIALVVLAGGYFFFKSSQSGNKMQEATPSESPAMEEGMQEDQVMADENMASEAGTMMDQGITAEEVAKHAVEDDCWVIVNGKVYDVTEFIPIHPGGKDKIVPACGGDATERFTTRNGFGPHPDRAQTTLDAFLVGDLK